MRISFILSSLHLSGGVRVVIQYANRMIRRGHEVSLIIPGGTIDPMMAAEVEPGVKIIQTRATLGNKTNPVKQSWLACQMALAVEKSDVIIATHTPTTAVSLLAGKLLRKGKIIWFYQDYPEMFERRPIEKWLLRNALRWHDAAVTVSEACQSVLKSYHPGKIIIVGEGLETKIYHPIQLADKQDYGCEGKKVVFFLGDSRPRKGMDDFLKAAEEVYSKVSNLLIWIGSKENTPIRTALPYHLFIRPSNEELARLYSVCDVFVSASWSEGFGLPPLEAMACGAAVVTTDSRGVREFAVDGENCLVVPIKNPDRLAEAIVALLSNSELTDKLRMNGQKTAARFDWELATDRFEAALAAVVQ